MRVRFIRPGDTAPAVTRHLPTLRQFASDVLPAPRQAAAVERGRHRTGERS